MRKKLLWMLVAPLILSMFSIDMMRITLAETHDIAVISVTPYPTSVKLGELVNITVVIENQGTEPETFNVTTYQKTVIIETKTVQNLGAGANTSLTFTWNTGNVREEIYATYEKEQTYAISAKSNNVPSETDTEDNKLVSASVVRVISQFVAVIPQSTVDTTLTPGKNYTISLYTDYNRSDITGYQFTLFYNPSILQGVEVKNGDLIAQEKDPSAQFMPGVFNNTEGKLSSTGAFFFFSAEPAPTTSGPGTLATVTFTVIGTGASDITLGDETKLIGYTEGGYGDSYNIVSDWEPGIGHLLRGYFQNAAGLVVHDIAVVSVSPSPTLVEEGKYVNITVVVENQGTEPETFDITIYSILSSVTRSIGVKTITDLAPGDMRTVTFLWNVTRFDTGDNTIKASASAVSGETDTEDNTFISSNNVTVTMRSDGSPQSALPTELIITILIVVAVIGAAATYAIKRRKKPSS